MRCEGNKATCKNCRNVDSYEIFLETFKQNISKTNAHKTNLMNEEIREEMIRNKIQQTRINIFGPVRKQFEESKKELKLKHQAYFKDETMTGNAAHEVFNDFRKEKNTILQCFKNYPKYYQKHLKLFTILTNIDTKLKEKKQPEY